jgi:hypothetical protein
MKPSERAAFSLPETENKAFLVRGCPGSSGGVAGDHRVDYRVGELLRAIDSYSGQPATEYALKLAPLLFLRPGEEHLVELLTNARSGCRSAGG